MDRKQSSQVLAGVLLIALGLMFLAERLNVGVRIDMGHLWPVILLVIGVVKLARGPDEDGRRGGFWLLFLGALFLLHTYDVLTLRQSWPLFIVAGGISIILGSRREPRPRSGERTDA